MKRANSRMMQNIGDLQIRHKDFICEKFLKFGLEAMEPQEVLELLLSFTVNVDDAPCHAAQMIDYYHGFINVINADCKSLMDTPGIDKQTVILIRLASEMSRYINIQKSKVEILSDTSQIIDFLKPHFTGLNYEKLYMLCLDNSNNVLCLHEISNGSSTQASFNVHYITREAVRINATKIVLAHNHPCGTPYPSSSDHVATNIIRRSLAAVDVSLVDHIIIANGEAISIKEKYPLDNWS